jgi:hypothetical protein
MKPSPRGFEVIAVRTTGRRRAGFTALPGVRAQEELTMPLVELIAASCSKIIKQEAPAEARAEGVSHI